MGTDRTDHHAQAHQAKKSNCFGPNSIPRINGGVDVLEGSHFGVAHLWRCSVIDEIATGPEIDVIESEDWHWGSGEWLC